MRWQVPLGAAILLLLVPTTGFGWFRGLLSGSSAPAARVYYCPLPVVVSVPVVSVPVVPVQPPPGPSPTPYAPPRPAPPSSQTPEPPRGLDAMPKAGVNAQESRKADERFFDNYFVAGQAPAARDRCSVTFWNLSRADVDLTVAGQTRRVPAGRNLHLDLARSFSWSVAGHGSERQDVPAQEAGVEIVIRR